MKTRKLIIVLALLFVGIKSSVVTAIEKPDLQGITVSHIPKFVIRGKSFSITDTIKNNGTKTATKFIVRYYLSLDTIRNFKDILLNGSRSVESLKANEYSTGTATVTIPFETPLKSFYLLACADDNQEIIESNEKNNCVASQTIIEIISETSKTVPGSLLVEPPWRMLASDDGYLYISTNYALIKFNKRGGLKRTLTGNLKQGDVFSWKGFIENPMGIHKIGDYLYAGEDTGKIVRVFTGKGSSGSVEILLHAGILQGKGGVINFIKIAGNSTALYYLSDGGIYEKMYGAISVPRKIIDYMTGIKGIYATDKELFINVYNASDNPLLRYDLITRKLTTVTSGIEGGYSPMTLHGSTLFWISGSSLYSMEINAGSPKLIASNIGMNSDPNVGNDFRQIAVGDEYIFLLTVGPPTTDGLNSIYRVSIQTGDFDVIYSVNKFITSIAFENNKLYFATANPYIQLNSFTDTWQPIELFNSKDSDLGPGTYVYDIKLASGGGKVILSTGYKFLIYDIATNSYSIVHPIIGYSESLFKLGGPLYTASHNGCAGYSCIVSIPIDKDIRQPDILNRDLVTSFPLVSVRSTTVDQDFIYWIWKAYADSGQTFYGISKSDLNGSTYEKLFESDGELRDIGIHNGKLFFACNNKCGTSGWALASMPISGGQPMPIYGLLGDPKIFYKNSICYVADTENFKQRSLFAINLEQKKYIKLMEGLYYQPDLYGDVFIDRSQQWLYIGQYHNLPNGMPEGKISRFKVKNWDNIGPEQIIISGIGNKVSRLRIGTITTDGSHLYYWHNGEIKRIKE